tara:strand:+ start:1411 stop:2034 length:624 start_codon:yes stop_codon:yes gene_type:complete
MSIVKLNNRGVRSATAFGSITGLGSMVFIKKQTASSSATISFVDGTSDVVLDDTYKEYLFTFNNMHPQTDGAEFQFNISVDSGSNYNVTKTTTTFDAEHNEDDSFAGLQYLSGSDLAQSTSFQNLNLDMEGTDNDGSVSGHLHLFNPSSTTFVKHFIATTASMHQSARIYNQFTAGYGNTTSAVDAIQFKMSTGNIDAGDICLYGIN